MSDPLPDRHPAPSEGVRAAFAAIYDCNYEPEIEPLRTLYAHALDRPWIAMRQLDWEREIDRDAFSRTFSLGGIRSTRCVTSRCSRLRSASAGKSGRSRPAASACSTTCSPPTIGRTRPWACRS